MTDSRVITKEKNPIIHRLLRFGDATTERNDKNTAARRKSSNARRKNAKSIAKGINSAVSSTKKFMIDKPLGIMKDTGNRIRNANNNSNFSITGRKKYKVKNSEEKTVDVSAEASLDENGYVVIALIEDEKKKLNATFERINDFGAAKSGGAGPPTRKRRAGRNAASHLKKSRRRRSRFL